MNHYHYQECGLDNVWLENGYEFHETPYGKGVSFLNAGALDATIAKALTEKPAPLTGKELRFLRIMLNLSQKTVGELMGKEAQTVALWEKADALKPD
ncbi:helix-turn-helix domain-containing protein, partial [Methylomagnum sp.]